MSANKRDDNRRKCRTFEYKGTTINAHQAADLAGCTVSTINKYVRKTGWDIAEIIRYCAAHTAPKRYAPRQEEKRGMMRLLKNSIILHCKDCPHYKTGAKGCAVEDCQLYNAVLAIKRDRKNETQEA